MGLGLGVRRGLIAPFVLALVLLLGASCAAEDDPSPMLAEGVIDRSAEARRPVDGSAGHSVDFASISVGGNHGCGVRSGGSLECWGDDAFGRCTPPRGTFVSVSAGSLHACGVRSDGSVACWGYDGFGQASPPPGTFSSVSAGGTHSCGVRSDGSVECWGGSPQAPSTALVP